MDVKNRVSKVAKWRYAQFSMFFYPIFVQLQVFTGLAVMETIL